ncbi:MAG: 50S ribosomal protein L4 [Rhodospirillales bacterium]|nr:50S ribosomal protein L4 [Rhodospirillales bacterium]
MKCDVISLDNKKSGSIDLDETVFGIRVRPDLMARVVNWQLANRRAGTHKTKGRSEVRGSTKKPFRQKGTGRARQGSAYVSQMRGGGVVFGPVNRTHLQSIQKKVRRLAMKSALSAKQAEGKLVVLDQATMNVAKTSLLAKQIKSLGWGNALVIDGADVDENFMRAASNIIGLDVLPSQGANVYDILRRETLVLTKTAVEKLVERLK